LFLFQKCGVTLLAIFVILGCFMSVSRNTDPIATVSYSDHLSGRPARHFVYGPGAWTCLNLLATFFIQRFCLNIKTKGNSFSGDKKYMGMGEICKFRLKSPHISETVRDRPMVAVER